MIPSRLLALMSFLAFAGLAAMTPAAGQAGSPCDRFGEGEETGRVRDATLVEISGLAASRTHAEVIWAHNDSGGRAEVSAMAPDGRALGVHTIDGATAVDWEDMAVGPGPDPALAYIFIGDIGDNASVRDDVTVYRLPEPSVAPDGTDRRLTGAEAIRLRYPGGPSDAEALLVDPVSGDLFVLTKQVGTSRVLRAPAASLVGGAVVDMEQVARFPVGDPGPGSLLEQPGALPGNLVTAADVSADGTIVLVRTYRDVLAFVRPPHEPLAAAFAGRPCPAPQREESQGEAIAFTAPGDAYLTASEGAAVPVYRFTVASADLPPEPAVPTSAAVTSEPPPEPSTAVGATNDTAAPLPATGSHDGVRLVVLAAGLSVAVLLGASRRQRSGDRPVGAK